MRTIFILTIKFGFGLDILKLKGKISFKEKLEKEYKDMNKEISKGIEID